METNKLSRPEAEHLLLCLQQLEKNEAFKVIRAIAQGLYDKGLQMLVASCPDSIAAMNLREQAIGGLQELKRFLDQPKEMADELNQQINQHNNE